MLQNNNKTRTQLEHFHVLAFCETVINTYSICKYLKVARDRFGSFISMQLLQQSLPIQNWTVQPQKTLQLNHRLNLSADSIVSRDRRMSTCMHARSVTANTENARNIHEKRCLVNALFCNALFFPHEVLTIARGLKLAKLP